MDQWTRILQKVLHKEGLRCTQQRLSVWEEIRSSDDHRDAEEIYINLRKKKIGVSRATVYRTIDVLVKNGLVRKLDLGDGRSRFEHKMNTDHHDHIVCIHCGRIEEFIDENIEALQENVARDLQFTLVRHIHQLFGICHECQKTL